MMINNVGNINVFQLCICTKRKQKSSTTCKDQSESLCKLFTHVVYIYETQRVYLTPRRASACQGSVIVITLLLFLEC